VGLWGGGQDLGGEIAVGHGGIGGGEERDTLEG